MDGSLQFFKNQNQTNSRFSAHPYYQHNVNSLKLHLWIPDACTAKMHKVW